MSPLTTHVLDTAKGMPASGMEVSLHVRNDKGEFEKICERKTNSDGRIPDLIDKDKFVCGVYRLTFATGKYLGGEGFFPRVDIVFEVKDSTKHHHVPLLLSPFGYSTYRGS